MTIHLAPIVEEGRYRWNDPKFTQHFRVYQMYRQAHPNSVIAQRDTFWCGKSFKSQAAMEKALSDPATLEYIASELQREALDKHWNGLEVASTVVAFYPNWDQGYAIDSLDSRHLKRALKHHLSDPKPAIGKKPHLAWSITKSEGWPQAVEAQFLDKMQNLRQRSNHLENLVWHKDGKLQQEFSKVAPIWFNKNKGLERVGDFFLSLMDAKRYEAHRDCLEIWGALLMQKPEALFNNFRVGLTSANRFVRGQSNPLITPGDSFNTLNTLLAMYPETCLSGKDLLSDSWVKALKDPENKDAAMVAILSGYARYQKKVSNYEYASRTYEERRDGKALSDEAICIEFWRRLGHSAGMDVEELLSHMGEFEEGGSKTVAAFFASSVKASNQGMSYDSCPQPIAQQCARDIYLRYVPQALDVLMKAKLLSHPAFAGHYVSKVEQDQDRDYFMRIINHPLATLEQIKAVMPYDRFTRVEIDEMEAVDPKLAKSYIAGMKDEQVRLQIAKHNIPAKHLSHGKHRDHALGTDLGL
ncbi:hypothetical protein IFT48_03725 [Pseudomonas fluorescens]|uniref:hypothetical protein n=1 Tax=Pseudomonas TaxID=286 RepID=UPI000F016BF8|nr:MULTISPECIES: hypothetical protein [Pseudomonas]MBD8089079.1 hypothetical protein [Pseudomonas fluorescens]MBD8615495.1 hypothetical protein [Pseudomonas putida]